MTKSVQGRLMKSWHVIRWAGTLAVMSLIVGCGQSGRSPLGKVTGTVTCKGRPVEKAAIIFHNPKGRSATGQVVAGNIEGVTTYDTLDDGAAIGTLTVTIHPMMDDEAMKPKPEKKPKRPIEPGLPPRYGDPKTSNLTAEIQAGENEIYFDLTD
jgi:hypothetical protein